MQTQIIQMNKFPEGWEVRKLRDACMINPKKSEIKDISENMEVSFIPMDFVDEKEGIIKEQKIRKLKDVTKGYTYFKENDVLFAKITPCMENGKSAIARNLKNGIGFGSTEFHVLRPNDNLLVEYLFHFIRQTTFREEAKSKMSGTSGHLRVPTSFLENYEIPLPPLPIQSHIVSKLDAFFEHYNRLKKEKQRAKEQYDRIMQSAIASLIPQDKSIEGWEEKLVKDITLDSSYGPRFPAGLYSSDGIPTVRITDMNDDGTINFNTIPRANLPKNKIVPHLIKKGDFLTACTGSIGRSAVWKWDNFSCIPAAYVIRFRFNDEILSEFFYYFFRSRATQIITKKIAGGTTQINLNSTKIKTLKIPIPSIEIQKQIVKKLDDMTIVIKNIQEQQNSISSQLSILPKSVLSKAFRGELV